METLCHKCGTKGHLARVCRSCPSSTRGGRSRRRGNRAQTHTLLADGSGGSEKPDDHGEKPDQDLICTVDHKSSRAPYKVVMEVNGQELEMEVDTGAAVSVISKKTQLALFPVVHLAESTLTLRTYTAEPISVGADEGEGQIQGVCGYSPARGCHWKRASPLGCDWLSKIRLDWASIHAIAADKSTSLSTFLSEYTQVFEPGTRTLKHVKGQLTLKESARPCFCRVRPVPFTTNQLMVELV